jgi:hypothetical protein
MRWRPIILDLALVIVVWTLVLWLARAQRVRMGETENPRAHSRPLLTTPAHSSIGIRTLYRGLSGQLGAPLLEPGEGRRRVPVLGLAARAAARADVQGWDP